MKQWWLMQCILIAVEEHEATMEDAERCDRLEYNEDSDNNNNDNNKSIVEGNGDSE